jgi:ribonucleoside-diphosphate reductase beta chain
MGIGYFSAAEGIVGDNIQHVVRELVTAPELKLVLGRHAHEENIHADSLLYMIASLGSIPHECEAMFEDDPDDRAEERIRHPGLPRAAPRPRPHAAGNKQLLAKNIFVFGQCMEGTQFYGLFGMVLSLYRQNKFPGIGQMFRYTLRDESNHIEVFRNLFMDLVEENREIWTAEFKEELRDSCARRRAREGVHPRLPAREFRRPQRRPNSTYIDYIADRRLEGCGLPPLNPGVKNPLPWLAEMMDIKKEQNFFEGKRHRIPESILAERRCTTTNSESLRAFRLAVSPFASPSPDVEQGETTDPPLSITPPLYICLRPSAGRWTFYHFPSVRSVPTVSPPCFP